MVHKPIPATFREGSLNTLAQSETGQSGKQPVILQGQGSDIGNAKVAKGRAKRKFIGQAVALALVDIARRKGNSEMEKACWNTYHCQSRLCKHEGRIYGHYCKNRFCPLCCSIRKADYINRYLPVIHQWPNPHFVTLTVRGYPARSLPIMCNGIMKAITRITAKYRKAAQRGKGSSLIGIRSLECNFNPKRKTYNPHLHIIVPDEDTGEILIEEWLQIWTSKHTIRDAQLSVQVKSLEGGLIEIIKYGCKVFTEPDKDKKLQSQANPKIYAAALYNIYEAMKGIRIFDRFGFDLPKAERPQYPALLTTDYDEYFYLPEFQDWHNSDNAQMLTGSILPPDLEEILSKGMDKELE